jgi:hypothetical protein
MSSGEAKYVTDAFAQGLNEIGYVEGRQSGEFVQEEKNP